MKIWKILALVLALVLALAIPALADEEHVCQYDKTERVSAATCTEAAQYQNYCKCGEKFGKQYDGPNEPALNHKPVTDEAKSHQATCTEDGIIITKCERCNELISEESKPAIGHSYDEDKAYDIVPATCTTAGSYKLDCQNACNHTETKTIAATGHSDPLKVVEIDSTCTAEGYKNEYCTNPGCPDVLVKSTIIEMKDHTYVDDYTVPVANCTTDGYIDQHCSVCGKKNVKTLTAPGHVWSPWTVVDPVTCTEDGFEIRYCAAGVTEDWECTAYETRTVEALGHDWEKVTSVEATCTTAGAEIWTCQNYVNGKACGTIENHEIPAKGHSFTKWTVTEDGTEKWAKCDNGCPAVKYVPVDWTETPDDDTTGDDTTGDDSSSSSGDSGNTGTESEGGYEIPATGDNSITWAYLMMAASAIVLVAMKRRVNN